MLGSGNGQMNQTKAQGHSPEEKRRVGIRLACTGVTASLAFRPCQLGLVKIPTLSAIKPFQHSIRRQATVVA